MRFDGPAFRSALPVGPLLAIGGYAVLLLSGARVGDWMLAGLLLWPTLGALAVAVVRPGQRVRWLSAALGALAGTALVVGLILGVITAIATMLSDPAPGG